MLSVKPLASSGPKQGFKDSRRSAPVQVITLCTVGPPTGTRTNIQILADAFATSDPAHPVYTEDASGDKTKGVWNRNERTNSDVVYFSGVGTKGIVQPTPGLLGGFLDLLVYCINLTQQETLVKNAGRHTGEKATPARWDGAWVQMVLSRTCLVCWVGSWTCWCTASMGQWQEALMRGAGRHAGEPGCSKSSCCVGCWTFWSTVPLGEWRETLMTGARRHAVAAACRFIKDHYQGPDNSRIWLFGLSRGAYTVRAVAGMINNCGIIKNDYKGVHWVYYCASFDVWGLCERFFCG